MMYVFLSEFNKFIAQLPRGGKPGLTDTSRLFLQKEWENSWWIYLKLIIIDVTVNKNVLGFRDNNSFYGIQRYLSNDHVYDKLSGREGW
jgi:hypothetical protein